MSGRHRKDGGQGFDPKGRAVEGDPKGEDNPSRTDQSDNKFDQAEADRRAEAYRQRHQK